MEVGKIKFMKEESERKKSVQKVEIERGGQGVRWWVCECVVVVLVFRIKGKFVRRQDTSGKGRGKESKEG